jgi:glycosyltransferase involved in cell wall biosynthesis
MMFDEAVIQAVLSQRLVNEEWYRGANGLSEDASAIAHFLTEGWPLQAAPNQFFEPEWYRSENPDIPLAQDPLTHYIAYGEAEGRWPCRHLDPAWYAAQHGLVPGGGAVLSHYLRRGAKHKFLPNCGLAPKRYLTDKPGSTGALCSASIDHLQSSPKNSATEVRRFAAPGPDFEDLNTSLISGQPRAKVIALYLPQFHAIPENDEWWGTGFTEWRNVCRGQPRFAGHHQPHIPRDLGFYDLVNDPVVMQRQIELAKAVGIYGFCFYYYQFGKRKLLEKPLQRFLADSSLDFSFCLIWANENWTRRWDGLESEVLLKQEYCPEDDENLIDEVAAAMADPRYIRVEGRPLFIIYRPGAIPQIRQRIVQWREVFRQRHGLEPWLLMAQVFYDHDPRVFGLDGAVEFPPHKLTTSTGQITDRVEILDATFTGRVWDYNDVVANSLAQAAPPFPLIRTAVPSWDNDARRQGAGDVFAFSTPEAYQRWMEGLIGWARQHRFGGEALVFVNAWNEWGEGAHLEPDVHFGSAYLNATARALVGQGARAVAEKPHLLLVGHDAHEHGAQMTCLNLGRTFARGFGLRVTFVLLGGGRMLPRYREIGEVIVSSPQAADLGSILAKLYERGIRHALTNTVITGAVVGDLKRLGFRVLSLVHEMPRLISELGIAAGARAISEQSDVVVFAAHLVRDAFEATVAPVSGRQLLLPQGLYAEIKPAPEARPQIRAELQVPVETRIVLGLGYGDLRKGFDLFVETARLAASSDPNLVFLWVGATERTVDAWILNNDTSPLPRSFRHVPFTQDVSRYLHAADAFYLTSREDPFPSTVLEALACGLPVVGFAGCSGTQDLIERFGELVPASDTSKALNALVVQIASQTAAQAIAREQVIAAEFNWKDYAFSLLEELNPNWRRISVVVPNYNYCGYLEERLLSIFRQTVPVYEIIVLDDCSTDNSLDVAERVAREQARDIRVIANLENSGSVMKQWLRGAEEASGELIWMAEADDTATPLLLEKLAARMRPQSLMAFCDSAQIDHLGARIGESYRFYYSIFHGNKFDTDFRCEAKVFASNFLVVSNIILNVSSVLFRRQVLYEVLRSEVQELASYRFAGDWLVYLSLCQRSGEVTFCAEPLNVHRRHGGSATHRTANAAHVNEIARIHETFGKLFDITPQIKAAQRAYRDEVTEQFGTQQ